jgi:hypothetical protein
MFDRSLGGGGPATGRRSVRRTASTGNLYSARRVTGFSHGRPKNCRPHSRFSYVAPRSEDIDLK